MRMLLVSFCFLSFLTVPGCKQEERNATLGKKDGDQAKTSASIKLLENTINDLASSDSDLFSSMTKNGIREYVTGISHAVILSGVNNMDIQKESEYEKLSQEALYFWGHANTSSPMDLNRARLFVDAVLENQSIFIPGETGFMDSSSILEFDLSHSEYALVTFQKHEDAVFRYRQSDGKWLFDGLITSSRRNSEHKGSQSNIEEE